MGGGGGGGVGDDIIIQLEGLLRSSRGQLTICGCLLMLTGEISKILFPDIP